MNDDGFVKIEYYDVLWLWYDCTVGLICECGKDVSISSDRVNVVCECGRVYRLVSFVEVKAKSE